MNDEPRAGRVILSFEGVSRRFGAVTAVDGVSFDLIQGEILTLLGPSGCGKTTTLRMAIGLERASGGRIRYRGKTMDSPGERIFTPPERRDMGMVFQSYAIWPHMDVFENVAFPLRARNLGREEIGTAVREALSLLGLAEFERRAGTALSGGQQQRVAVARGLVAKPEILLMDEPFSNLDAKLRDQVRAELKVLQRRLGISILFVTHDQSEALALSDRIAVMNQGRIEQIASPTEIYTQPAIPFVRDFVGQSIRLPGRIIAGGRNGMTPVRLDNGQIVEARGSNHLRASTADTPCLVTLRPEELLVAPSGPGSGQEPANRVRAIIRTLLFLGRDYEAIVELPCGRQATLYLPRNASWQEGQSIALIMPPESLQLWEQEASEGD